MASKGQKFRKYTLEEKMKIILEVIAKAKPQVIMQINIRLT